MRYFYETIGECVSQIYEIKEANGLDEAKEIAFPYMDVNDILCECADDIDPREEDARFEEYHHIDINKCTKAYALDNGLWMLDADGNEYYNDTVYTWAEYSKEENDFVSDPEGEWFDAEYNAVAL